MRKRLLTLLLGFLCIGQILAQTTYKEDKTICEGNSYTFTASNGNSYQWQKNGVDIPGATNITYAATEAGEYSCKIITNGTTQNTGNLLSEEIAGFEFPATNPIFSRNNSQNQQVSYQYHNFQRNPKDIPIGSTTTAQNANNVKEPHFNPLPPHSGSYMLVCDGTDQVNQNIQVWRAQCGNTTLKKNTTYQFSCWVANIDSAYTRRPDPDASLPKLEFFIETAQGTSSLKKFTAPKGRGRWQEETSTFQVGSNDLTWFNIYIVNYTGLSEGNDFALDDIYFGTVINNAGSNTTENFKLSIDTKPNVTMPTIPEQCPGATVEIKPTVSNVGSSVQYSWSGAQTANTKDITATAQATVRGQNNYTFTVTNGVCDPVTKYISVITKSCSSTLEKLYATCIGETCNLSQITTTGTGVWTDADGNSLSSRSIMILDNTEKVYTCTVSTTDANGDPITITETHTIKPYNCDEQYTPCETSQHVLSAKHEGRYEWNTGETSKTIVITAGNINDIDEYTCKVTFPSTPNETSIVETHYVRPQMCHIPETKEICKDNNLSLSPKATGDEYIWTLNGAAISNPQTADGSIVINHNTVTPQGSPHKYVCKTYKKANTEGAPNIANNLIENGDFEDASSSASNQYNGFGSNYQFHELNGTFEPKTSATIGYYRLTETGLNGTTHADATNGGHYFLECDGDSNEGSIAYAAPINTPIVKGKEYQFAYSAVTTSTVNFAEITFELVLKNEQGEVIKTEPLVSKQLIDNSTWKQFGVGEYWTADDDYAQAEVRLTNATTTYGGNDFGLDNIMFQPVYRTTSTIDELIMTTEYDIIVTDCTEETERDDEFLIGSTITLKSEIEGGDTYLWYHHNNDPVLDASGNHIGGTSIEIVLMDPANDANINNYYCVVTMPAGVTPSQITEFITLNIFEPTSFNPCQFDEVTLTPTLTGSNENWYRLLTFNDLTQKEVLTGVVGDDNKVNCQDLVGFLNFETGANQISLVRTITDENGTARDEQWNLTIDPCQETKAPVVKAICQGESYTWNNTSYTATTEKTNVYKEKRDNRYWEITESLNLTVNPNPSFQVEVDGRTANIITQSNFDFITLDNQSTLTDTKYTWLSIGDHTITMTDNNGCSSTQAFSIVAEPIAPEVFFTPNDDGNNDTWDIDNLEYYPDAIIQIYDRYSRLLSSIKGIDFAGWDGYYNGHIMPMDDYWYVILIPDNNTKVSGHFILKR